MGKKLLEKDRAGNPDESVIRQACIARTCRPGYIMQVSLAAKGWATAGRPYEQHDVRFAFESRPTSRSRWRRPFGHSDLPTLPPAPAPSPGREPARSLLRYVRTGSAGPASQRLGSSAVGESKN
jgi:hypothetical protein